MKARAWTAVGWGACGAWMALVCAGTMFRQTGHVAAGEVCGVVSLPWLALALVADRKAGKRPPAHPPTSPEGPADPALEGELYPVE